MSIAPNTFLHGTVSVVPGSDHIVVHGSNIEISSDTAVRLSAALSDAAQLASLTALSSNGRALNSITGEIHAATLRRRRDGRIELKLDLFIDGHITSMTVDANEHHTEQTLMQLLGVWALDEINGQDIEVLYTNDSGTGFTISNGSMPRALRNLDVNPEVILIQIP